MSVNCLDSFCIPLILSLFWIRGDQHTVGACRVHFELSCWRLSIHPWGHSAEAADGPAAEGQGQGTAVPLQCHRSESCAGDLLAHHLLVMRSPNGNPLSAWPPDVKKTPSREASHYLGINMQHLLSAPWSGLVVPCSLLCCHTVWYSSPCKSTRVTALRHTRGWPTLDL